MGAFFEATREATREPHGLSREERQENGVLTTESEPEGQPDQHR
jgi:hypothetical protein